MLTDARLGIAQRSQERLLEIRRERERLVHEAVRWALGRLGGAAR